MSPRRSLRARAALINASSSAPSNAMSRPRRAAGGIPSSPSVTVSRSPPNTPEDSTKSIRLTVKMPASKLREVTTGVVQRPHNIFAEAEIMTGPRNSRTKKKLVEVDTDDDEDMDDEEDEYDEDAADPEASDDDGNAPSENMDADGDVDMDDESPVPVSSKRHAAAKPVLTVTPAVEGQVRNVDSKNMELDDDDDDDDELSELDTDAEGEDDDEVMAPGEETGAEAGAEEAELEEGDDDDEDESDSELGTPATGSRDSTPNAKMTKRQRGRVELGSNFLQLPMEPQVKKHLTAEEHAMRRAEMARRRKNLSEKRNEEEKMDTINKLLKKQAPKRRGKISAAETGGDATPRNGQEAPEPEKADPTLTRWVSTRDSCRVGVPSEWLGVPVGRIFSPESRSGPIPHEGGGRKLVEEV